MVQHDQKACSLSAQLESDWCVPTVLRYEHYDDLIAAMAAPITNTHCFVFTLHKEMVHQDQITKDFPVVMVK